MQAQEKMKHDEREWQNEFGALPAESESRTSAGKSTSAFAVPQNKLHHLSDFSGYMAENDQAELSLGKYFSKRSEDLRQMIPNKSPTKRVKPIALIPQSDYSSR